MRALECSWCWKGPTCSTLTLVGNWGHFACSVPVDLYSEPGWTFLYRVLSELAWGFDVCIEVHNFRQCEIREFIDSSLMSLLRISIEPLNPLFVLHKNDPPILLLSFSLINLPKLLLVLLKSIRIASLMDMKHSKWGYESKKNKDKLFCHVMIIILFIYWTEFVK